MFVLNANATNAIENCSNLCLLKCLNAIHSESRTRQRFRKYKNGIKTGSNRAEVLICREMAKNLRNPKTTTQ